MSPVEESQVVLGLAVPVPEPLAGEVAALRASLGGRDSRNIPTHVTLIPPTSVPTGSLALVEEHLAQVLGRTRAFEIHLEGTGTFRPVSDVAFLRLVDGHVQCDRLQRDVRTGPLAVELRFPYHPHVTLAHDVGRDALDRAREAMRSVDLTFTVDEVVLYVDRGADDWHELRRFTLGLRTCGGSPMAQTLPQQGGPTGDDDGRGPQSHEQTSAAGDRRDRG